MFGLLKTPDPLETPEAVKAAVAAGLLKNRAVSRVVEVPEEALVLDVELDGEARQFNIDNLLAMVAEAAGRPRAQHAAVRQYIRAFLSVPAMPELDLDKIYPLVRHGDYVAPLGEAVVKVPVAADLVCALTLDAPQTLMTITHDHLADAELAQAEAWGAARVNLMEALQTVETSETARGTIAISLGETWLATSLMLAPSVFDILRKEIGAERLYIAPARRDAVELIDADAPNAFEVIGNAVRDALTRDHPQSSCVFLLEAGQEDPEPRWILEDGTFRPLS